jgi:hypothetical protein
VRLPAWNVIEKQRIELSAYIWCFVWKSYDASVLWGMPRCIAVLATVILPGVVVLRAGASSC